MPLILAPDDYPAWLGEDAVREVSELLRPFPSESMRAYRVSTAAFGSIRDRELGLTMNSGFASR